MHFSKDNLWVKDVSPANYIRNMVALSVLHIQSWWCSLFEVTLHPENLSTLPLWG